MHMCLCMYVYVCASDEHLRSINMFAALVLCTKCKWIVVIVFHENVRGFCAKSLEK